MKPISVLAVAASIAVLAGACKKSEPVTSETNTTGATVQPEQPAREPVPPPVTTGTPIEQNSTTQSGMTTQSDTSSQSGTTHTTSGTMYKGKDAGASAQDWPSGGSDLNSASQNGSGSNSSTSTEGSNPSPSDQSNPSNKSNAQGQRGQNANHSTPLGDSKSGEYTGGKGTYGGKATWGTGPRKDTNMDQSKTNK